MVAAAMRNLLERTGKSATDWAAIVEQNGPPSEKARREWLKSTHGFTTNYASWIAELSMGKGREHLDPDAYLESAERYVEAMFAGKRAALRPLYDRLLEVGLAVGKDAKACPCQTIVPLYRGTSSPRSNPRLTLVSISDLRSAIVRPPAGSSTPVGSPGKTASRTAFPLRRSATSTAGSRAG